jgi:uncharacterized protein YfaS (alpha-2-macroglobulin family)
MRQFLAGLSLALLTATGILAQEPQIVPERHISLMRDTDLAGGDIQSIFDTSIEACENACLANKDCRAITFNSRKNACFIKSAVGDSSTYEGAVSGFVHAVDAAVLEGVKDRRAELSFLQSYDLDAALMLARSIGRDHVADGWTVQELVDSAAEARANKDPQGALGSMGAAVSLSDQADLWVEYAQILLEIPATDDNQRQTNMQRAVSSAINGYLRTKSRPLRATALATMAQGLEGTGRGAEMIPALKLAQDLSPRDDTATALEDAIGKYGFRVQESRVEADGPRPRICAVFNQPLKPAGTDYATYVQLPEPNLTVDVSGSDLCVTGLQHGKRYTIMLREGLPSASGEELVKPTEVTQYVRDRAPAARFPGRAYILPRATEAGIPVETVNTQKLDLVLQRVSDRNLIRAIQNDYFGRPLDYYSNEDFTGQMAQEVWRGTAEVAMEVNRDMTTRLPLDGVMKDLGPGIYTLQASVPGVDPYDNPPASQWFVISDLGLTTLMGSDGLHVFVRGLSDAEAREGVVVKLISRANAVIATARTDAQGYARLDAGLTSGTGGGAPALVSVEQAEDYAFLSLTEAEFDLSDRGVAGREAAPPIDVFLSTDRGAYRAGETVNATILARDPQMKAIDGLPLTVRLTRPDGVEYSRALTLPAGAGGHTAALPIAGNAPRGTWRLDVFVDEKQGALASQGFLVEDFLPERIDFTLALPDAALQLGAETTLDVAAKYLFGAPGAGLAAEGELRLSAATGIEAFPGYVFGRHDAPFVPSVTALEDLDVTDAEGNLSATISLPAPEGVAQPLDARLTLRLTEGSGRPVERQVTRRVMPDQPVIGIKPQFKDGVAPQGAEAAFDLIAVGPDEKTVDLAAHWTINRLETNYQWYSVYGNWNWEVTTSRVRVAEGDVALAASGRLTVKAPVDWGQYEIVVTGADGRTASSMTFYAGWYAPVDTAASPDTLELSLDKPAYKPGETATLRIVPRADGVALVTVMSNHLIAMKAVPVIAGENTIDLDVTDEWGAGAYVTASVIRPVNDASRTPVRALGLSYATVDPGTRRLQTSVEVAPEAAPRGPLPVAVKVEGATPGDSAFVTIAAVDLGILNLTAFKSPDPEAHYFAQQKLGMAVRDIYGRLIDSQNGAAGIVRSGGDANAGLKMQAPPPTEELVAYFSGAVPVGTDGYARTEFTLPSFNGTVRIMAVAWSNAAVGQSQADVLVRDPVVVTASVPRFLAPGDTSRVLLEIVHATGPAGRMGLDVTSDGLGLGAAPSGLDLAEKGKAVVSVPITAGEAEGIDTIRIALTTPDGKQLTKSLVIPVQANDPEVMKRSRFDLAAAGNFTLDQDVFADYRAGTGRATLAIGPLARFDAPGLLASLDRYPYGCTEQLTSKALPLLYFDQVAKALGVAGDADLGKRIDQTITEILLNQSSNGAFGLWYAESGDLWLDAYVTDFLSRARAMGHAVPETAFRNAMDNLRNQVNYAPDFDKDGGPIAYALMVLAREGAAAVGDLRYYADVKAAAFDTPMAAAQLAAALASYGDQTRADAMFARAAKLMAEQQGKPEKQLWRADYGTTLRDGAALLALASEAGSKAVPVDTLGEAVASAMSGRTLSTQEATWALLATNALIDRTATQGFTMNGTAFDGPLVKVLTDGGAGPTEIGNGSGKASDLTLTTYGVPAVPGPASGNGYAISRSWFTLEGEEVDPASVKQGSRLVTVVEVTPLQNGEARLIVNDPLPAGFEIDNPNLIRAGDLAGLDWLDTVEDTRRTEFRQDRFIAAVDWTSRDPFRLAYIVRAVSPGSFHLPAASVEDMYRPDYRAHSDAGRVVVTE